MEQIVEFLVDLLWDWPLIITILSTGIYYTLSSEFFQIKYFTFIWRRTFKAISNKDEKNISMFQTLFASLGTTTGIGNITGVTSAVVIGGPGAIFWMLVTGILGMIIKMAEVTLAVYYRDEYKDGTVGGGPMQYIEKGIGEGMNFKSAWVLSTIFGVGILSTLIFTIQNYNASVIISNSFNVPIILVAITYSLITYAAIYKGTKGIKELFIIVVPVITLLYVGAGVLVIVGNGGLFVAALKGIIYDAFSVRAVAGGFIGRGLHETISKGMSRGVYSNEAGWGTSAMIHSTASTNHPIEVGLYGVVEVFLDTIVICFITGIVVVMGILSGISPAGDIVVSAFSLGIGEFSKIIIPITIFLFGLTTSIGWYSYYESILLFFYTRGKMKFNMEKLSKNMKRIYPIPGFIIVVITTNFGGTEGILWGFADILAGIPTFVNMFVVLLLSDKFFELLQDYKERHILCEEAEVIPIFYGEEDRNYYNF